MVTIDSKFGAFYQIDTEYFTMSPWDQIEGTILFLLYMYLRTILGKLVIFVMCATFQITTQYSDYSYTLYRTVV